MNFSRLPVILNFIFTLTACDLAGQTGRISGTILDAKTGETLPGATILIEGSTKGAAADLDGRFSINNAPEGKLVLVASYVSYTNKKIEGVQVKNGDVVLVDIGLEPESSKELQEVEVITTLNRENNTALVLQQKNNNSLSDGISAESIKRTPDRNASDVLKRISGVTVQEDKFVVVRGLNERYNTSYLNGAPLPSTEPDKKAFAFNLFPSNMVENIVVNKTATPDMPSEFAGGIVQVNTKSIPENNFFIFSAGTGLNTITTGREKLVYVGGKYDKVGFDDHSRDLPSEIPALSEKRNWITNNEQGKVAGYFDNDWSYRSRAFSPNTSSQLAAGYNIKRKERDFAGILFSISHNISENRYTFQRTEYDNLDISGRNTESVVVQKEREYSNETYQTQASTGAMMNLSLKANGNNNISLKNVFCGASDNRFISSIGSNNLAEAEKSINRVNTRYYSANRIFSSQLNSEHFLPSLKLKFAWNGAYSDITRSVPNLRYTSYSRFENFRDYDPAEGQNRKDTLFRADIGSASGPNYSGYRVYSDLHETVCSGKADLSRNFNLNTRNKFEIKSGVFYQQRSRQFDIRQLGLQPYGAPDSLYYLTEDKIFDEQNLGKGGFKAFEMTKDDDNYHASSSLKAIYLMGEYRNAEKLRIVGGARSENYIQFLGVKYPRVDSTFVNNRTNDLLPSVNVIYNITGKTGIRASYCKTLNRPEFRELALTNWFDPETRLSVAGNPALERSYIRNYDLRFEIFPGGGQLLTTSGFFKHFNRPIERYLYRNNENLIYYSNANTGRVYGLELEYRLKPATLIRKDSIKFLSNLTLFSNLSLMRSEVDVKGLDAIVPETRPMQGQALYIINTGLTYADRKNGISITAAFNRVGPKIYLVGNNLVPNRWENARNLLDLQVTKALMKGKMEIRMNVKDLLQQDWVVFYRGSKSNKNEFDPDRDYVNLRRNYGCTFSFSLSYKF